MKKTGIQTTKDFTFSATKHGLIRMATTFLAAYMVMTSDVEEYAVSTFASIQANLLWAMWQDCLKDLSDERKVAYLIGL